MTINPVDLKRYFDEVDAMSAERLKKYATHVDFCLKNRGALVNRLRGYTIKGLKMKVVKSRQAGSMNVQVARALVYKILSTLTREELEILRTHVGNRLNMLALNEFCEELEKETEE